MTGGRVDPEGGAVAGGRMDPRDGVVAGGRKPTGEPSGAEGPSPAEDRERPEARIGYQGEPGAFSEEATLSLLGEDQVRPIPFRTFHEVVEALEGGAVDAALLPVENSIAGSVTPSLDLLASRPITVRAEVVRPIIHCLLGRAGASMEKLRRVISHPVALAQCTLFLREHRHLEAVAVHDTAGAAREVAEGDDDRIGAIAGPWAAERYGLTLLQEGIQDRQDNRTRFWLVVREGDPGPFPELERAAPDRLALVLETRDRPGALLASLEPFAREGLNLRRIESRPGREPWTYRFFLEVAGRQGDEALDRALEALEREAATVRILGSFVGSPEG